MLVDSDLRLISGVKIQEPSKRKVPWWGIQCKQVYSTGKTYTNTLFITEKKYQQLKATGVIKVIEQE
ncbi:MAG: hypothetical protein J6S67_18690 [Methanobrevibacter sp.]|nr:hypothetical protein [Methanobrevibacter sp.]